MKQVLLSCAPKCTGILFIFLILSSNKGMAQLFGDNVLTPAEMSASFDDATSKEKGNSALEYNQKGGFNICVSWYQAFGGIGRMNVAENRKSNAVAATENGFLLREALEFIQKGYKFQGFKTTFNYLELLIDLAYQYQLTDLGALFAGLGPYVGYGLGGKYSGDGQSGPTFSGQDPYKRLDFGLDFMVGYAFAMGLEIHFGYELGLYNMAPSTNGGYPSDYTAKNRAFTINVGYSIFKLLGKD
jgi:hypothetical protein